MVMGDSNGKGEGRFLLLGDVENLAYLRMDKVAT